MRFVPAVVLLLSLVCCAKRVPIDYEGVVNRGGYAYKRINSGEFIVASIDDLNLHKAMSELGCGTKYICIVQKTEEAYDVELHAK